jgi:cation diffusion facilitator family transporter
MNLRYAEVLLPRITLAGSLLLVIGLFLAAWTYESQLALAQAADSFMDMFTAAVLTWTVTISHKPRDEDHPFGHTRAQPIGGLVTAVIAGVVALEVLRSAIGALVEGHKPELGWLLVAVFAAKAAFKIAIFYFSRKGSKRSPALRALMVDARNDTLVSLLAIGGFFAARFGMPTLDAWLALPIAVWIAWSGVELARANIKLLMGEAPPDERQSELVVLANSVEGVINAHDMRAQYMGTHLHVHVHVVVDPALTVKQAHDIGEAVRLKLETQPDVQHCSVHIDIE